MTTKSESGAYPVIERIVARNEIFWQWLTAPADMPRDDQLALLERWTAPNPLSSSNKGANGNG